MSETNSGSTGTSTNSAANQGTAVQPAKGQATPQGKTGSRGNASNPGSKGGQKGGPSVNGQTFDGARADVAADAGASERPLIDLPEDFDLDTTDEALLKKLAGWKKKIKVNGKEQVVPLLEAIKYMQKDMSTQQRMQAIEPRAQILDRILQGLESDPDGTLEQLARAKGIDLEDLAKKRVMRQIQLQAMTEDQRGRYDAEQKAQKYEDHFRKLQEKEQQQAHQQGVQASLQKLSGQFLEAFKSAGLNIKHPMALSAAADFFAAERQANPDATVHDVMPKVKNFLNTLSKQSISSLSGADLYEFLGKDAVESLRTHILQTALGQKGQKAPIKTDQPKDRATAMTADEYREMQRKRFGA